MAVKVRIPSALQKLTGGASEVEASSSTVQQVIEELEGRHDGFKRRLCEDDGSLRRFINIFVNDEDIRFLEGVNTQLKDGDELSIVPAIAGG
jgi:molybdopterin synthase sulfur carrier subunit